MEKTTDPEFDPNLLHDTWWTTFNGDGESASYEATSELEDLPQDVRTAIVKFPPDVSGLGEQAVNWNLTCVSKDGSKRLRKTVHLQGGSRSGRSCGENDLWATAKPGSSGKRNQPVANGSAAFGYKKVIYLIDGGLCPCLRCCQSLLGLATRTASIIVVRPITDYELITRSRTKLEGVYLLVFEPGAAKFTVYYEREEEAPALAGDRDVTKNPTIAWMACPKCHTQFSLRFASQGEKSRQIKVRRGSINTEEYPSIDCPQCQKARLELVQAARGKFPARVLDF